MSVLAELKILGVKRVEALQSMLDAKYKTKIAELAVPSQEEIETKLDAEFGITKLRAAYNDAFQTAKDVLERLNEVTGGSEYLNVNSNYRYGKKTAYSEREDQVEAELRKAPVAALTAERDAKKNALWLCETLEDARAIVDHA